MTLTFNPPKGNGACKNSTPARYQRNDIHTMFLGGIRALRRALSETPCHATPPTSLYAFLVLHYMRTGYHYGSLRRFLSDFPPPDAAELAFFCIEVRCLAVARSVMAQHFALASSPHQDRR